MGWTLLQVGLFNRPFTAFGLDSGKPLGRQQGPVLARVGGLMPVLRPSLVCCQYFNVTTAFVSTKRGRLSSVLVVAVEKAGSLSRYPLRSRGQAFYLRSIVIERGRHDQGPPNIGGEVGLGIERKCPDSHHQNNRKK